MHDRFTSDAQRSMIREENPLKRARANTGFGFFGTGLTNTSAPSNSSNRLASFTVLRPNERPRCHLSKHGVAAG